MSNVFVIIKMCYVHNQWYDISCATLYFCFFQTKNFVCGEGEMGRGKWGGGNGEGRGEITCHNMSLLVPVLAIEIYPFSLYICKQ